MTDRSNCKFALIKNLDSTTVVNSDGSTIKKTKKVIQKIDENGQPMFTIQEVTVKKGCKCKGNQTTEIVQKKVPVTEEIWVEEVVSHQQVSVESGLIMCKLYGKVKRTFCDKCSTFKPKPS